MSEQNETPIVEQNNAKNEDTQVQTNENMIPQSRFNEVNAQKNKLAEKLANIEKERESERAEQLAKQGEYKTMYEEQLKKYDSLNEQANSWKANSDAWGEYKTNKRASIMERITNDDDKAIAEGLSLNKLEMFANRVTQTNTVNTPNQRPANKSKGAGEFGGYNSITEFAQKDPAGCDKYLNDNVNGYNWGKRK
tara:strand:+ start:5266 stop:5847 length:582 start_codon:yes stop_codon:yes gene_type:complete